MQNTKKYAFTMIELVIVIVVLGILAALAIPRLERDIRQEAADNILSAIRYTQHLALIDDKTDPSDANWQKKFWHLRFARYDSSVWFYTISSNVGAAANDNPDNNTNIALVETAIDPATGKHMYHRAGDSTLEDEIDESPTIFIGEHYGVNAITFQGGCTGGQLIAFDYLGRPHVGIYSGKNDYRSYMSSDCTMVFSFEDSNVDPVSITIEKETGYAFIVGQPNS